MNLPAFNFILFSMDCEMFVQFSSFFIKKFNIKVNGEIMNYNEEMILTNKSVIYIGNEDFYFLLPN